MMADLIIAPFQALEGSDMKRVTQFDIYLLGTVRSLQNIHASDVILSHRNVIILSYLTLDSFINNKDDVILLPASIREAIHLRSCIEVLQGEMGGSGPSSGRVTEGMHEILSRAIVSFEVALKNDLNNLPTYIIERIGIYNTDGLLTKADDSFPIDIRPFIPLNSLQDYRKAGTCLAFELYTASGFHGYRAVDATLRAYCAHFTGNLPKQRDWGKFISALRNVSCATRTPNVRTVELIDRIRSEDRNPLIHPETDLNEYEAKIAFDLCRTAITFMAGDIKNAP